MKYYLILMIPMGLGMLGFGAYELFEQHRLNTTFEPIEATIKVSEVKSAGRKDYRPLVVFHYRVGGGTYTSDRVFPTHKSGAKRWAADIARRFTRDDQVTAWYDPERQAQAFLIKHYDFMPYGMVLMGTFMGIVSLFLILRHPRLTKDSRYPKQLDDGWWQLNSPGEPTKSAQTLWLAGIGWEIVGVIVWGHYFIVVDELTNGALMGSVAWFGAGLVAIALAGHWRWTTRWVGEPTILIDSSEAVIGEPLSIRVEQFARRATRIKRMEVQLVCERMKLSFLILGLPEGKKKVHVIKEIGLVDCYVDAGETVSTEFCIPIPANASPSIPVKPRAGERFRWILHQKTCLRRRIPPCPFWFEIAVREEILEAESLESFESLPDSSSASPIA